MSQPEPDPPVSDATARFRVSGLEVAYRMGRRLVKVVGGADFEVARGEVVGIAGESGSGKTTAVLSAIGYVPAGVVLLGGESFLDGESLTAASITERRHLWATKVSYIAQDAAAALNPVKTVGSSLLEVLRVNRHQSRAAARQKALELLKDVRLPNPVGALDGYPHEFSGGQLQRIAIAIALACDPELVILDEPTTGLDVTTQSEVIEMLGRLINERGLSAVYISHDLALLAAISHRLVVFYAGEVVEFGLTQSVLAGPRHPYTRALLDALPSVHYPLQPKSIPGLPPGRVVDDACSFAPRCLFVVDRCRQVHPDLEVVSIGRRARCIRLNELGPLVATPAELAGRGSLSTRSPLLLSVEHLVCTYRRRRARASAVTDVSLGVCASEVVALVGESGSGKTTIARAVVGLLRPDSGRIEFEDTELGLSRRRTKQQHRDIQLIFQNPESSLNPRQTVGRLVGRSVELFRPDVPSSDRARAVRDALLEVQLAPDVADRYPHQLSGGQMQRVAIARAFVTRPRLVVCDEIISGQDVSVQAAILDLVREMQAKYQTALLFISHDLAAVRSIAQYVYVIQGGSIVEEGLIERVFDEPHDPYTQKLLASVLEPDIPRGRSKGAVGLQES